MKLTCLNMTIAVDWYVKPQAKQPTFMLHGIFLHSDIFRLTKFHRNPWKVILKILIQQFILATHIYYRLCSQIKCGLSELEFTKFFVRITNREDSDQTASLEAV